MDKKQRVYETEQVCRFTFFGVAVSTIATMTAIVAIPMLCNYMQNVHTSMQDEITYCKSRNQAMKGEFSKIACSNETSTGKNDCHPNSAADGNAACKAIHDTTITNKTKFGRRTNSSNIMDDNGLIRMKSRLEHAQLPFDAKNPLFLPRYSQLVRLIINEIHVENGHCGLNHILSLIRLRFWIPKPTTIIKRHIRTCATCKKEQGLPFSMPTMAPLSRDRVVCSKPFENVGCDYMGPWTSKEGQKMYVAIYTCLTTRAVHLEVAEDLTAGAFLHSFIRFSSRRGVPAIIRTDCGTNFTLGAKIIKMLYANDTETGLSVMSYSANKGIRWIFNPPGAPWMGGVWERLVGTVKRAFHKMMVKKGYHSSK
uniref:Integrase catalytic domain-containing protein n=1 Tax=Heterorhabditis bacteriophora TaxID=37862 RepID=A0A1I7XJM3_HETBA